jgi:hypothetical protein
MWTGHIVRMGEMREFFDPGDRVNFYERFHYMEFGSVQLDCYPKELSGTVRNKYLLILLLLWRNSPMSGLGLPNQAPPFLSILRCSLPIPYTH